jgi:DNA polymerase-3 subunit epsilon
MTQIEDTLQSIEKQDGATTLSHSYLLGFDTETTGVSPQRDAIVSATLVLRNPALGHDADAVATWVINPHRPIAPAASAVNGFTNEYLQEHGEEPTKALAEISDVIVAAQALRIPLLAYNAPFDVAMIEADLKKWQLPTIAERLDEAGCDLLVVDPLVIDRAVSKRKGKRTLTDTTFYYGVHPYGNFHDATADTIAAIDIIAPMSTLYPQAGNIALDNLMAWQRESHEKWETSFIEWMESKGRKAYTQGWL